MQTTKNLAIIGASYLQIPLIRKAKEMGYKTHVFAWAANDVGEQEADVFYPISIVEKEQILDVCRNLHICGICSISSDLASVTVNYVAAKLGLTGNSLKATENSTNKHAMRRVFAAAGDPSPLSIEVDEASDVRNLPMSFPVIVKPTDRSGSRGICRVERQEDLKDAVAAAMAVSFEKKALIEEYVTGQEYSVEYISWQGTHHFLAVTQKETTGAPAFIETAHLQPAPLQPEVEARVRQVVEHALNSLGIENGASHSEVKIDLTQSDPAKQIRIIEIGGRMGGDCIGSDMVLLSTGVDFVRAVIQVAVGEAPDLTPVAEGHPVMVRFLFAQEDVDEMNRLKAEEPERFLRTVFFREEFLDKAEDSSSRAGCYLMIPVST